MACFGLDLVNIAGPYPPKNKQKTNDRINKEDTRSSHERERESNNNNTFIVMLRESFGLLLANERIKYHLE